MGNRCEISQCYSTNQSTHSNQMQYHFVSQGNFSNAICRSYYSSNNMLEQHKFESVLIFIDNKHSIYLSMELLQLSPQQIDDIKTSLKNYLSFHEYELVSQVPKNNNSNHNNEKCRNNNYNNNINYNANQKNNNNLNLHAFQQSNIVYNFKKKDKFYIEQQSLIQKRMVYKKAVKIKNCLKRYAHCVQNWIFMCVPLYDPYLPHWKNEINLSLQAGLQLLEKDILNDSIGLIEINTHYGYNENQIQQIIIRNLLEDQIGKKSYQKAKEKQNLKMQNQNLLFINNFTYLLSNKAIIDTFIDNVKQIASELGSKYKPIQQIHVAKFGKKSNDKRRFESSIQISNLSNVLKNDSSLIQSQSMNSSKQNNNTNNNNDQNNDYNRNSNNDYNHNYNNSRSLQSSGLPLGGKTSQQSDYF